MPAPCKNPSPLRSVVLCIFSLLFGFTAVAQTSLDEIHVTPSNRSLSMQMAETGLLMIRDDVNLVLLPVSVTDPDERAVTGLEQRNFQVFEDKKPQQIRHFSSQDEPASLGIIVDTSGSMADKIERVREAVQQFCEAANPQDEIFLITFSDEPHLLSDFTNAVEEIQSEIVYATPKGRTALLDAIHMGLEKMRQARYARRALLVISDGGDNHSRYTERQVKAASKEADVMIYSIGIFDRYVPTREELLGPELMREIAEPTGGRAFIVDHPNQAPAVAHRIGIELRTEYVIGYRPDKPPVDGKWHKIKVKLLLPGKWAFLQVHSKTGYYAKESREQ